MKKVDIVYSGWLEAPNGASKFLSGLKCSADSFSDLNVDMNIMYTGSEYSGKFVLPDGQKGKCNSSNVNVRTSPTTTSGNNVLFQVHNGYQFTILQEQNGWYQVSFGADRIGWISGLYVTLI